MVETISPQQLEALHKNNPSLELIDVRTPAEYQEVHVEYAKNVPLDRLNPQELIASRNGSAEQPLYVICKSGSRGQMACQKIEASGFSDVYNIEGGTSACVDAGLPVVRGKKVMSLERQVRIAAGLLVMLGCILALTVNINWIILPSFVGAGLVFAGLTNTCGMGMILARMPWNQAQGSCGVSS